jgi:hypothetical protein
MWGTSGMSMPTWPIDGTRRGDGILRRQWWVGGPACFDAGT